MAFRVDHTFDGINSKSEPVTFPSLLQGLVTKQTYWQPVVINLVDSIDSESAAMVAQQLVKAEESGQPFVPFYIHSNGGEVYALMSIIESMRKCRLPIYTATSSYAASCAACIFTCGHRRFMGKYARLLLHDVSVDLTQESNMTSSNLQVEADEMRRLNRIILRVMAENVGHPPDFFEKLIRTKRNNDIYVDARKAVEWKLATDIGCPTIHVSHRTEMSLDFKPEPPSALEVFGARGKKRGRRAGDDSDDDAEEINTDDDEVFVSKKRQAKKQKHPSKKAQEEEDEEEEDEKHADQNECHDDSEEEEEEEEEEEVPVFAGKNKATQNAKKQPSHETADDIDVELDTDDFKQQSHGAKNKAVACPVPIQPPAHPPQRRNRGASRKKTKTAAQAEQTPCATENGELVSLN